MRAGIKLPAFLWVDIYKSAVYLNNRMPKYFLLWQSPYKAFYTYLAYRDGIVVKHCKPQQAHLHAYGCKVYTLSAEAALKKNHCKKLDPKAWVGYLVGYNSMNIYRIWNPRTNKVIAARDIAFNEHEFFSGNLSDFIDDLLSTIDKEMESLLYEIQISK